MSAPAVRECLDFAVANGEDLDTCNAAALQLKELLRRDWAVRTLDAWSAQAEPNESRDYSVSQCKDEVLDTFEHWYCDLHGSADTRRIVHKPTPDAARLAAAEAVWPELPESVRAELGERP